MHTRQSRRPFLDMHFRQSFTNGSTGPFWTALQVGGGHTTENVERFGEQISMGSIYGSVSFGSKRKNALRDPPI